MSPFLPLEDPSAVVSILSQISIFGGVTDRQQEEIFRRLETTSCQAGEFIFQRGDEPSHIFIVQRGSVELFIPDHEHVVEKKRLGIGDCFGQVAVLGIHSHTISAVALEDCEFIVLSKRALLSLHHEDIGLFALLILNLARELARRLQFVDALLLKSVHSPAQISGH